MFSALSFVFSFLEKLFNLFSFFDWLHFKQIKNEADAKVLIAHFDSIEGIAFPLEYIMRSKAWLCYDKYANVQGGFALVPDGPFRVISQLAPELRKECEEKFSGKAFELTGVWLQKSFFSRRTRYWFKVMSELFKLRRDVLLYAVDADKTALREGAFNYIREGIIYEGPVASLEGMDAKSVSYEAVEYASKKIIVRGVLQLIAKQLRFTISLRWFFDGKHTRRKALKGYKGKPVLGSEAVLGMGESFLPLKVLDTLRQEYSKVESFIYWREFIFTAIGAWGTSVLALYLFAKSTFVAHAFVAVAVLAVATMFFHRAQMFAHELSHFRKQLPGLSLCYNLIFGFFLLKPAYRSHAHGLHHSEFGTVSDPELWPERHGRPNFLLLLLRAICAPGTRILRTFMGGIVVLSGLRSWVQFLFHYHSTCHFNPYFKRPLRKSRELDEMVRSDLFSVLLCANLILAWLVGGYSIVSVGLWWTIVSCTSMLETVRSLALRKTGTLGDAEGGAGCVTVASGVLTPVLAPLHMSFQSLHHCLPEIPFHALPAAHQRLKSLLGRDHAYWTTVVSGILPSFIKHFTRPKLLDSATPHWVSGPKASKRSTSPM